MLECDTIMKTMMVFDDSPIQGSEDSKEFNSDMATSVRLRESLAKAFEDCYPLAGSWLPAFYQVFALVA
jgi:hypothetical protein